jgi:uncharacterized protein (TIGR03382 family)
VDVDASQLGYLPEARFLGADELTWTVSDGTAQSSYTVGLTVSRILTCARSSDCGGGDVCVAEVCTAPGVVTPSGAGGCSTGGGAAALSLLALVAFQLRRRRRSSPCRAYPPTPAAGG